MQRVLYRLTASAVVVMALTGTGCGAGDSKKGADAPVVRVSERDFRINAPERMPAGDVVLSVHNRGPDDHELIVVRSNGSELPFRADGLTVDEDAVRSVGTLEAGQPGATRKLRVRLKPGRYEMVCNMSGHYLGGMEREFEVR